MQYKGGPSVSNKLRIQKEDANMYSLYDSDVFVVRSKSLKEIADSICERALMAADNFNKQRGLKQATIEFFIKTNSAD